MARERAQLEGAHEVRYAERGIRPRHHASLDEVREAVDALVVERRALPEPAPVPAPEPPAAPPVDPARREALEPVLPGRLVAVESRYRVSEGEVVAATYETEPGATRTGIYLLTGGAARPFDDVEARIDALPEPAREFPPPAEAHAPAPSLPSIPEDAPPIPSAEAPKRKGFGLKLGKAKDPKPAAADAAAEPPADAPSGAASKKRFGFGRK